MGGFLQQTAGQWLVNFLSDILQTSLPEFQPYENSIEENESLSLTGREMQPPSFQMRPPPLWLMGPALYKLKQLWRIISKLCYTLVGISMWSWDSQIWDKATSEVPNELLPCESSLIDWLLWKIHTVCSQKFCLSLPKPQNPQILFTGLFPRLYTLKKNWL